VSDLEMLRLAVLLDPDDDLVRLAFADELEATGDLPRAEFVRVQVELANWQASDLCVHNNRPHYRPRLGKTCITFRQGGNCACKGHALRERNRLLLNVAHHHWLPAYAPGMEATAWTRGFIDSVRLERETFMQHAAALFSAHPIRSVILTDRDPCPAGASYFWARETSPVYLDCSWCLPADLFDLLPYPGGIACPYSNYSFVTPADGHDALSIACVRYGLGLADPPREFAFRKVA